MDQNDIYKYLFEAPGDEEEQTTEEPAEDTAGDPPAIEDENPAATPTDTDEGIDISDPPDLTEDDMPGDDSFTDVDTPDLNNLSIDEKISSILNVNLYKNYMQLLSDIGTQLNTIKNNIDIFQALNKDTNNTVKAIRDLDSNLRDYMVNTFKDERYENNLLFYNKCKALYQMLNEKFEKDIHKAVHSTT